MIDEIKTQGKFGYTSVSLSKSSHKKIICQCDICGKERILSKKLYRPLCISCCHKGVKKSPEHCCNISKGLKGKYTGESHHNYGKHRSKEIKMKISVNHSKLSNPTKLPKGHAARNKVVSYYKRCAKNRDLSFNLTNEEVYTFFTNDCHYCGAYPATVYKHKSGNFVYNGIDRKDNDLGYTKENCVSCCKMCNLAKRDVSYEDFLKWIQKLVKNINTLCIIYDWEFYD